MSETCVDDVIGTDEGKENEKIEEKEKKSEENAGAGDAPSKAVTESDSGTMKKEPSSEQQAPVQKLAPNAGRHPRLSETKKSESSPGPGTGSEGEGEGTSKGAKGQRSESASSGGPKLRYRAVDKLSAIDRAGHRVQIWAREKSLGSCGGISNGDSLDLDFELEEPFSDSEEEDENSAAVRARRAATRPHLKLPMPRRRIRSLSGTVPPTGVRPVWGGPTMCLGCLEFFDLPKETEAYVSHLLDHHRIVITDIELIVDLKRYVEHWRHRFGTQKIDEIFPEVKPEEGSPLHGKVDSYFLMSEEKVKEDRDLRERLALRRLEEVLACQQRERGDFTFQAQCLFCRYRARGNRSKMIHHLYMIHHLNLGSPENLVFFSEYLDLLKSKIDKNQCLYCEKIFQDHNVLMEHMRKRQHREVNPKNSYYDRFYVINYLELGKKWLEVLAEDFEDTTPTFQDSDDEDEEESWHEWQEDNTDEDLTSVVCLFCDDAFQEASLLVEHTSEKHGIDLEETLGSLDFYDRVKLINYIRKQSYNRVCCVCGMDNLQSWEALRKHLADHHGKLPSKENYDKEEHLIPVFENDHMLWVLESYLDSKKSEKEEAAKGEEGKGDSTDKPTEEGTGGVVVVPEDLPELVDSIFDKEPDLLEQLK